MADDMLHVRLQTVGVIEHSMKVNTVGGSYIWRIYDVGGTVSGFRQRADQLLKSDRQRSQVMSRTFPFELIAYPDMQRPAWCSYFDDGEAHSLDWCS